ncbi:MAG: type IV pilus modification protein PilV [Betaproteobacteria bacterium]|nr:type IV pilus modification protein PilV [Betaproteobacteria bacterium]
MKASTKSRSRTSGFVLLEALIAILIFSIGVLGLIGLQAMSAKHSTDAKYRSEAALLVNQLLGNMWVSDRTIATLQSSFNTGGSAYNAWLSSVTATLPGVVANTATAPTVTVDAAGVVSVAVFWIAPSDAQAGVPHNITTVTQIR